MVLESERSTPKIDEKKRHNIILKEKYLKRIKESLIFFKDIFLIDGVIIKLRKGISNEKINNYNRYIFLGLIICANQNICSWGQRHFL